MCAVLSLLKGELLSRRIPLMVSMGLGVAMLMHLTWALRTSVPENFPTPTLETGQIPPPDFLALALDAPLLDGLQPTLSPVVSQTALQARLQGVSTGLGPALAIIDHAGHSRIVTEEDALGDDVRVHRILPDRVLLRHGSRLETLALHRESAMPNGNAGHAFADDADLSEGQNDGEMQQWMQTLSEADPETAAWLRERLKELHEREPND
jgi:hypothetical protein